MKNQRQKSIRQNIFLCFVGLTLITVASFAVTSYQTQRRQILANVDARLAAALEASDLVLPPALHDAVPVPGGITPAQHALNVRRLSVLAKSHGLAFVYTFARDGAGVIRFTSTSATPEQEANASFPAYADAYDAPPNVLAAFASTAPRYVEGSDDFGSFRSLLALRTSPSGRPYLAGADIYLHDLKHLIRSLLWQIAIISATGLAIATVFSRWISARLARRIIQLEQETNLVDTGKDGASISSGAGLEALASGDRDEIDRLARAFVRMIGRLSDSVARLNQETAVRERMEKELSIARDIQQSLIPTVFSPFPHSPALDLHGIMEPAREVGGDLFDFIFLRDGRLCFLIGDVSDKGVPAAMFMSATRMLFRACAESEPTACRMMSSINRVLCQENPSAQFVTAFLGILDPANGTLEYCDAGHPPPWFIPPDAAPPVALPKNIKRTMAIGIVEDYPYASSEIKLAPGGVLVAYTDGVADALNEAGEQFGEERFRQLLAGMTGMDPETVATRIATTIAGFVGNAPRADDVTLLVLRVRQIAA